MALSLSSLHLYEWLFKNEFKGLKNVIELGSQDVTAPGSDAFIQRMLADKGASGNPLDYCKTPAKKLYEALGLAYTAIDIDRRPGTLQLDLNTAECPEHLRGTFDLVTNHGTTEHVFNQYNCFVMMHDLCKPGGRMFHAVPYQGYALHCFFAYRAGIFYQLARFNRYTVRGVRLSPRGSAAVQKFDREDCTPNGDHLILVAMKKNRDAPMFPPYNVAGGNPDTVPLPLD